MLDQRRALLEDGDARAPVGEDVVVLDPAAALLAHEHARVHALVDLVVADERVAAGVSGEKRAAVVGGATEQCPCGPQQCAG